MQTTFENAQKGDRAYCSLYGGICNTNLEIIKVTDNSITIKADVGNYEDIFSCNGTYRNNGNQILFWSKPVFEIPVRPKRLVKIQGFIGISMSRTHDTMLAYTTYVYPTEELVKKHGASAYKIIPISFEVEKGE